MKNVNVKESNGALKSVPETATWLGLSLSTIRRAIEGRELGFFRCGRRILISEKHIATYLMSREVQPINIGEIARQVEVA